MWVCLWVAMQQHADSSRPLRCLLVELNDWKHTFWKNLWIGLARFFVWELLLLKSQWKLSGSSASNFKGFTFCFLVLLKVWNGFVWLLRSNHRGVGLDALLSWRQSFNAGGRICVYTFILALLPLYEVVLVLSLFYPIKMISAKRTRFSWRTQKI